jgi:antagonist of KipI
MRNRKIKEAWSVGSDSNRVGMRLDGPPLALSAPLELISEGVAAGTVQLPLDGRAIIIEPEHPVTGGYLRIGQVIAVDQPVLAQCRPGDNVAFQWTDLARAVQLLTDAAPCWND